MLPKVLVAYVPVLHEGYVKLFRRHSGKRRLYILGEELTKELTYLEPEIRAVQPYLMRRAIEAIGLFSTVEILNPGNLIDLRSASILAIDEAITRRLVDRYQLSPVKWESIWLRWDEANVYSELPVIYDRISTSSHDRQLMQQAYEVGAQSADWWRRVGGLLVKDGRVIDRVFNQHVPDQHLPYIEGDPRDFVPAGQSTEIATSLHVEQQMITRAARRGCSIEDCDLHVTVFPCPMCAKQVAYSGIKSVYFASGHASLDGERILKSQKIELVLVK